MDRQLLIRDVYAREILDSRGNLTIEAEVLAGNDVVGRASVPSDAYAGTDVRQAVENINSRLADEIIGMNVFCQAEIDQALLRVEGMPDKANMGANHLMAVSMAAARAACTALKLPLYRYLGGVRAVKLPVPSVSMINGGIPAGGEMHIREFMIVPTEEGKSFGEQLQMCAEVYRSLRNILRKRGYSTAVGDEGGFAPDMKDEREALRSIRDAAESAGYRMGKEFQFALAVSASEIYDTEEMIKYYEELISEFPVCSIEDPLYREDWKGWKILTERIGSRVQVAGDELFDADVERIRKGARMEAANAVLLKMNQTVTLTEVFNVIRTAQDAGYRTIISQCSGETEDTFIADIAAAFNVGQIRTGAPCRSERTAKYNRLLRIGEQFSETGMEIH